MKKTNAIMKLLALVLAMMLCAPCLAAVKALADDVHVHNDTETVQGNVEGQVVASADDGQTASMTVTGSVDSDAGNAVSANANDEGSVTVQTGDVTAEDPNGSQDYSAVTVYTDDNGSSADVAVGDVTSDDSGVRVTNNGGDVSVTAGDIQAEQAGIEVTGQAHTDWENLTAEQFDALGFGEPDNTWENSPEDYVSKGEYYEGTDGVFYYHYYNNDGTESFQKGTPASATTGNTVATTESVTVTNTENEWSRGAFEYTTAENQSASLTVNGDISVDSSATGFFAEGASASADKGNAALTVNGNVTVSNDDRTYGAGAYAENGTATLAVNGDISVTGAEGDGLTVSVYGEGTATATAGNITAAGKDNNTLQGVTTGTNHNDAQASASVGSITADGIALNVSNNGGTINVTTGAVSSEASGVNFYSGDHFESEGISEEAFAAMNLGTPDQTNTWTNRDGSVTIMEVYRPSEGLAYFHYTEGDGSTHTSREAYSASAGSTTIVVNGDVTASGGNEENWSVYGVNMAVGSDYFQNDQTVDVTVNGSVTAESEKINADGVYLYAEEGTANGTITGNVTASGNENATGVGIDATGGTATLTVGGSVSASAEEATGAYAYAGEDGSAKLNIGGDVTAAGKNYATGLAVNADDGENEVKVSGSVAASTEDNWVNGVSIDTNNEGSNKVTVEGSISAEGKDYAKGLGVSVRDDSVAEVEVGGSVTAEAESATAAEIANYGGTITLTIAGDVESGEVGLMMLDTTDQRWTEYEGTVIPDESELVYSDTWKDGTVYKEYIHMEGDQEIHYDNQGGKWIVEEVEHEGSSTRVSVDGDVTGGTTGVSITLDSDKARMDLIVDGTITGATNSILVSENTITDNLVLTVWEIKPNDDGNLVERENGWDDEKGVATTEGDRALEKQIQYIIRIEQPSVGRLSTAGTTTYDGYEVAKEGDTVTLKVDVPSGYRLADAFNGTDTKVELLQDANGDYYIVVPRGGAVMLSVTLEKIEEKKSSNQQQAVVKAEPRKMDDQAIEAAVEQLLTKNDVAEDSKVEVKTEDDGRKTVVIAPEVTDAENSDDTALKMTVQADMLSELKNSDVTEITMVSKSGTATVSMEVAEVLKASGDQKGSRLVVDIQENSAIAEKATKAVSSDYNVIGGAVVVSVLIIDEDGNTTALEGGSITIRLMIEKVEGMKILFVDDAGNVTEIAAVWVEATDDIPGHWEVPYMGHGTYVPVTSK